jgi:predicted nuclease of predicted toxin-antitoxin system
LAGERIKFSIDEHVPRAVMVGLRRRGVDVLTTQEAKLAGAEDEEHLVFALREGRVFFTHDSDFLRLNATGRPHGGIVFASQQMSIGEIVRGLMLIYEVFSPDDLAGRVEYLGQRTTSHPLCRRVPCCAGMRLDT